jgi:hypothetical protein
MDRWVIAFVHVLVNAQPIVIQCLYPTIHIIFEFQPSQLGDMPNYDEANDPPNAAAAAETKAVANNHQAAVAAALRVSSS